MGNKYLLNDLPTCLIGQQNVWYEANYFSDGLTTTKCEILLGYTGYEVNIQFTCHKFQYCGGTHKLNSKELLSNNKVGERQEKL